MVDGDNYQKEGADQMADKKKLEPTGNNNAWMTVYVTHNLPEAHIVSGRLQHEGIPSFVHHAIGSMALGLNIGAMGEVNVVVHAENYARAQAILAEDVLEELPEHTDDVHYYIDGDFDANFTDESDD